MTAASGHALVDGPPAFATCRDATTYTTAVVEPGLLRPGTSVCVRTSDHHLALVTIVGVSGQVVELGATVWDPQVPW